MIKPFNCLILTMMVMYINVIGIAEHVALCPAVPFFLPLSVCLKSILHIVMYLTVWVCACSVGASCLCVLHVWREGDERSCWITVEWNWHSFTHIQGWIAGCIEPYILSSWNISFLSVSPYKYQYQYQSSSSSSSSSSSLSSSSSSSVFTSIH